MAPGIIRQNQFTRVSSSQGTSPHEQSLAGLHHVKNRISSLVPCIKQQRTGRLGLENSCRYAIQHAPHSPPLICAHHHIQNYHGQRNLSRRRHSFKCYTAVSSLLS